MKQTLNTVGVTDHAMRRWRERIAIRGDCKVDELIQAVKEADKIERGDYLSLPRIDGMHYYYNSKQNSFFVVKPLSINSSVVVTVIPGESFTLEDYRKLIAEKKDMEGRLSVMNKKDRDRPGLLEDLLALNQRIRSMNAEKDRLREIERKQMLEQGNIIGADGKLDYEVAILVLMKRVSHLESVLAKGG